MKTHLPFVLGLLLLVALGACGYLYTALGAAHRDTEAAAEAHTREVRELTATITARDARIAELEATIASTTLALNLREEAFQEILDEYEEERDRNDTFADQIKDIGSTVGVLDKLAKTDRELLMKYSKVYFLNEHYTPPKLKVLPESFAARAGADPEFIHTSVYPLLTDMIEDAKDDEIDLRILSAYRSFDEQRALKSAYAVTYGSGANTFSADQGYSEHQLGTTVDLTTPTLGGALAGFDSTPAYAWLTKNAYRYGFVLSYPKNNAFYIFEPWHWRFVGTDLARTLHKKDQFFYDMDQREIDTYLISFFD